MMNPFWTFRAASSLAMRTLSWLFLFALFGFMYPVVFLGSIRAHDSFTWTMHSWEVYSALQEVWALTAESESAQRSYVLTGDDAARVAFDHAAAELARKTGGLEEKVRDNPYQVTNAREVVSAAEEKIAFMRETTAAYDRGGYEAAARVVRSGVGLHLLERVRSTINEMSGEETRLLLNRYRDAARWLSRVLVAGVSVFMVDVSRLGLFLHAYRKGKRLREGRRAADGA